MAAPPFGPLFPTKKLMKIQTCAKVLQGESPGKHSPMIQQKCPRCNTPLRVEEQNAGLSGTCRHCGGRLTITRMFDERLPAKSPSLRGWNGVFVWVRAYWQTCAILALLTVVILRLLDIL